MTNVLCSFLVLKGVRCGYETILRNLLFHLSKNECSEFHFYILIQKVQYQRFVDEFSIPKSGKSYSLIVCPNMRNVWLRTALEQVILFFCQFKLRANIVFMPATFGFFLSLVPVVTFVHTMTSFAVNKHLRGRNFLGQLAHRFLFYLTSKTSSSLLFTTDQTKQEYFDYFKFNGDVSILGNGIYNLEPPSFKTINRGGVVNFLSISQVYRLKNFEGVIFYFSYLKRLELISSHSILTLVGSVMEYDYYQELLALLEGRNDIRFLHDVSAEELRCLYGSADCYLFLSRFEGFSLTPAEAISSGCITFISDIPVHREVYKMFAHLVELDNVDDFASVFEGILDSCSLESDFPSDIFLQRFSFDGFMQRLRDAMKFTINRNIPRQ